MLDSKEIQVGDYVEPISDFLPSLAEDKCYEDLFGFVIEKENNIITVEGIGRGIITKSDINNFNLAEVPIDIAKNKITRIKK